MSSKQVTVQFVYPTSSASSFNVDYYFSHHLPLVQKIWGPEGLLSWTASKGVEGADFFLQVTLVWESIAAYENSTKPEIMGDITNYTDAEPKVFVGTVAGSWAGGK
jgi:uncharacterized protein (TIGR02118 family)